MSLTTFSSLLAFVARTFLKAKMPSLRLKRTSFSSGGLSTVCSCVSSRSEVDTISQDGLPSKRCAWGDNVLSTTGLGMPGDVFFANFMTAHFIAPNTSPFIRYAIYFRVKSHRFGTALHNSASMLDPWAHWDCMQTDADPVEGSANSRTSDARSSNGEESGGCVAATAVPETVEFSDHDDAMVRVRPHACPI